MLKNKKILLASGLAVAVITTIGLFKFSTAFSGAANGAKYIIENFSGTIVENKADGEEALGAAEFSSGKIVHNQLAETVQQRRQVIVTANDLTDFEDHPVVLIPSPGSNKIIVPEKIIAFRRYSSESIDLGYGDEGFEVKWGDTITASGMNGQLAVGASFSTGLLTGGVNFTAASRNFEVWQPSGLIASGSAILPVASIAYTLPFTASSSALYLTGLINSNNVETSGITDFVFEVIYSIFPKP